MDVRPKQIKKCIFRNICILVDWAFKTLGLIGTICHFKFNVTSYQWDELPSGLGIYPVQLQ